MSIEIGGLPIVTLESPAPRDPGLPSFLSAQVVPGRAMLTLQIKAHLPERGETDLITAPPAEEARAILEAPEDFPGNSSYRIGGAFLLPYANRIRGKLSPDRRTIEAPVLGRTVRVPANAGGKRPGSEQYAMHGLLLSSRVDEMRQETTEEQDTVRGTLRAGDFQGRWLSQAEVEFENVLRSDSFAATIKVRNVGEEPLPMGIGWHPYFNLPSGRRQQARLRIPARSRLPVNDYDEVLPTGEIVPVEGTVYDFSMPGGRALGDLYLDDCFVDLGRSAEGTSEIVAEIVDPEASYGLRIIGNSPAIKAIQIYAPPDKSFVALEPQLNWADPFGSVWGSNADTGMVILQPGEEVVYGVRLELFTPV